MFSAFTTALPSSSVVPGAGAPLLIVDARVVLLALGTAAAVAAAVIVVRLRAQRLDPRRTVGAVARDTVAPSRDLSAA